MCYLSFRNVKAVLFFVAVGLTLSEGAVAEIPIAPVGDLRGGGKIHDSKIVKLRRELSNPDYLVAARVQGKKLKLIGFEIGSTYMWRRSDRQTGGGVNRFDLDAIDGMVLTAFQDRERDLRITTWDAKYPRDRIRRLDDWEAGRVNRIAVSYLRDVDGYHRFVTALSDSEQKHRIIVWDIEPDTGRIHRRGTAVGGVVGEVSLTVLNASLSLSAPSLIVTAVTDVENNLWTRVWKIDRAGNVSFGAGVGAGRISQVGVERASSSIIVAAVRESSGQLKMISYKVGTGGDSIERRGDYLLPGRVGVMSMCRTNNMGIYTAVENSDKYLEMHKWSVFDDGRDIRLDDASRPRIQIDRVACAGNSSINVVSARNIQRSVDLGSNNLSVVPYLP